MAVDGSSGRRLRPRRVFGFAAVLDLLVRYGERVFSLARFDPTLPAVSVFTGTVGAETTGLVVVAVGLYRYAPALLSPLETQVAETDGFDPPAVLFTEARAIRVCILVWGTALFGAANFPTNPISPTVATGVLVSVVIVSTTVLPWYCRRRYGWRLADPNGYLPRLVDRLTPFDVRADLRRDLAADGVYAWTSRKLWLVVFGALVAFPSLTVGVVLLVLSWTFPIPDVVALLSWLGSRRLRGWLPRRVLNSVSGTDPEQFALSFAVPSAGGLRGFLWGLVTTSGVVIAVLIGQTGTAVLAGWLPVATTAVAVASEAVGTNLSVAAAAVGVAWRLLGVGLVLLAAAVYTGFVWYRRSRRVAAQLRGDDRAPTAPPGALLPALVAVAVGSSLQEFPVVVGVHVGSAWPVVVATLAALVAETSDVQSTVDDERRGLLADGALSVFLSQFLLVVSEAPNSLSAFVSALTSSSVLGGVTAVAVAVYWPTDTGEPATAHPLRWYAPIVFAAVVVTVGFWVGTTTDSALLCVSTVVMAGFSTLFTVTRVHERRRAKSNQK